VRSISLLLALLSFFPSVALPPSDGGTYEVLRQQAEASYAEKSFARAHEIYQQANRLTLTAEQKRWVTFRLADTSWRAAAANPTADPTESDRARTALEALIREAGNDRDRLVAEANESLGDYYLIDPRHRNLSAAVPFYRTALDWWAGSDDLPIARKRYLAIVFRMANPSEREYGWERQYRVQLIPFEVLTNAAAIAETPQDRAQAKYLMASHLVQSGTPVNVERAMELLDEVIAAGRSTAVYDDALFDAAQRRAQGIAVAGEDGGVSWKPDFHRALELYRRITREFNRGETPHFEAARAAIDQIVSPSVVLMVEGTFVPQSEQEVILSWRNIADVELTITPIDLLNDMAIVPNPSWDERIHSAAGAIRRWTFHTNDLRDHVPGTDRIRIAPKLERGAYMVQASGGGKRSRQLLLVTDANIVLHTTAGRSDVVVNDAMTGRPIAGARIRVWRRLADGSGKYVSRDGRSGADGLATVSFDVPVAGELLVLAAADDNRQAFLSTYGGYRAADRAEWKVYAFTDRPAYRPGETVKWKFIARVRSDDRWITPAGAELDYEIVGPRGEAVASGKASLSPFGSFWSELALQPSMPLGMYVLRLRNADSKSNRQYVGHALLFRLEEYKLPEFRVDVSTPIEEGKKKLFRSGETIEATIEANYYFGGPVANATVEAVVFSDPYVRPWTGWRKYHWYWPAPHPQRGQEVKRETLRTDNQGHATLRIATSREDGDMLYRIEARVVDASRREVIGSGSVRVGMHRYSVTAHPHQYLYRPGERPAVDFKVLDANDSPLEITGNVAVVRRRWDEKTSKYREEKILETTVTSDADGEATVTFPAAREGYYAVTWSSRDTGGKGSAAVRDLVTAETTVWVSDSRSIDIGYRSGGLEIIVDKESFRAGATATAMVVTQSSGRWVVLSSSAANILETEVLHLSGTVKLVQFKLDERHVPSFHITASSVFDRTLSVATIQVVVPPVDHFINVELKTDREEYEPRNDGAVAITTRDEDGKPVQAEVSLSVSDEAVTAIQSDPAGDPRQFFFGQLRPYELHVSAGVQMQRYALLVERDGKLVDERQMHPARSDELKLVGNMVGASVGRAMAKASDSFAPQLQRREAMAEAITVTAAANAAPEPAPIEIEVRTDFRSTAFWKPDVITGPDGTARITLQYPEALTTWRATARAVTAATQVGMGSTTARTNLPLLVRLQAPRFFVAGDRVTISAVINNNSDRAMRVVPSIDVIGVDLEGSASRGAVEVPAHGEARADWWVVANAPGPATLRVTARGEGRGDAMEKTFTVFPHGIDKLVARSGRLRSDEALVSLDLPRQRRDTDLVVQLQPSLAVTMLDALPYLIDYPYGCTEQTMSRFLPAAIVARTLTKSGLSARDIEGRLFGGIEPNHVNATHPQGAKDLRLLDRMTKASMARLYDFQHADGGWGWWKDGNSDDFMTAYVVWGFAVAKEGGLDVNVQAVNRAVTYLDERLVQHENRIDDQTWMLHAIAAWKAATEKSGFSSNQRTAFDNVWSQRERLTAYSRALLALAAHSFGDAERASVLVRNLEDGVKIDRTPDQSILVRGSGSGVAETMATAHWGEDRFWWRWHDGPVESTAFALRALVRIDPGNRLIEPVMNWLVKNRRGAQWNNTRDTAIAILALHDYLGASGELKTDLSYEVSVNGREVASRRIAPADVLSAPSRITVDASLIGDANQIRIRRTSGQGPLYFAVEARFVSLEEPVEPAGNEIFVRRDYFRMVPRPTLLKGVTYDREPLRDNGTMNSGERVEVVITVESKNDYDYLLLEDLKPAGLEAVALQSGTPIWATELRAPAVQRKFGAGDPPAERRTIVQADPASDRTGRTAWVYQELRDRKVAMFIDHLPQGTWEIRYTLRAEIPGTFHALPLLGQAMYVPEIRANGAEVRMQVGEAER
jgi:alpha-2-macroglobulin